MGPKTCNVSRDDVDEFRALLKIMRIAIVERW